MNCENPQIIYNESLGTYMYVPCRYCQSCRISKANKRTVELYQTIKQYPYCYFITLTYNNDSLPIVLAGDRRIIRGCLRPFGQVLVDDIGVCADITGCFVPKNSKINNCVGVLYYPDLRNWFKRLRIYYEREYGQKFELKYFAVGEYGSHPDERERPHFHVVFYGRKNEYKRLLCAIPETWQYASWCYLDSKKWLEPCDAKTASYVASYVNCGLDSSKFLSHELIKQKAFRSKNGYYGLEASLLKDFKQIVEHGFIDTDLLQRMEQPFTFVDTSALGDFSVSLLPTRFLHTYFYKPRFCSKASYRDFLRRAGETWLRYRADKGSVKSSDYLFCLGYRKYLALKSLNDNFHVFQVYLDTFWSLTNYYASQLLKLQMMEYEEKPKGDYMVDLVDSYIDNPTKRHFQLRKYFNDRQLAHYEFYPISRWQRTRQNAYIEQYKNKLCKKHTKRNEINF